MSASDFRRFLTWLGGFLGISAATFLAMLLALQTAGSLPPPPVTATDCIDEKFKFLAEQQDLREVDLLAVGSSITWRNLDLDKFVDHRLASRPLNAATCYLFMDQTVFLTEFLLDHLPRVRTVVSVIAPRDFGYCAERDRAFFDTDRSADYIFEKASPLPIYAMNFRPIAFIRSAFSVAEQRSGPDAKHPIYLDRYGAGPVVGSSPWNPEPSLDPACFAALRQLEDKLGERGVRLVLVSFPPSPEWHAEHDPTGEVLRDFERQVEQSLTDEGTIFVSSESVVSDGAGYYDAVHFRWPAAQRFSARLADRLVSAGLPTSAGRGASIAGGGG